MPNDKFWWFGEKSMAELAARLGTCGPGGRLEVRIDKADKMTFRVVRSPLSASIAEAAGVEEADVNDSFLCPPRCPE